MSKILLIDLNKLEFNTLVVINLHSKDDRWIYKKKFSYRSVFMTFWRYETIREFVDRMTMLFDKNVVNHCDMQMNHYLKYDYIVALDYVCLR